MYLIINDLIGIPYFINITQVVKFKVIVCKMIQTSAKR